MTSSDFRQITVRSQADKADRLFRAAVSAFCSLTRPSRSEVVQLEDLTLPLFDQVSVESKRYVSAALSECEISPVALVKRLVDETADIAAPLLIRSTALGDADLVALIARHGWSHARAIGRRHNLNPAIADLVALLERKVVPFRTREAAAKPAPQRPEPGTAREQTLQHLRSMMLPKRPPAAASRLSGSYLSGEDELSLSAYGQTVYDRLRATVLSGHRAFFQTVLADALSRDFAAVRDTSDSPSYAWLLDALRLLDIGDEKAFLITAAFYPSLFGDLNAIRLFLLRYAAISRTEARHRIAGWQPAAEHPFPAEHVPAPSRTPSPAPQAFRAAG